MQMTIHVIVWSALITRTSLAGIVIETSKSEETGFDKAMVHILKTCYGDQVNTLGLAGYSAGTISQTLWYQKQHIPVTLIDETARRVSHDRVHPTSRHRLKVFVVTAMSSIAFAEILKEIKDSKWWNHMASVFILNRPIRGCSNAFEVLRLAWEMDLLAANFVCLHETRGRLIYTYNPYTSKAPEPWQLENAYIWKNNHVWTLLAREYRDDETICEQLDFEKAADMGGHKIRASVANLTDFVLLVKRDANGTERVSGFHAKVAWTLFRILNATPVMLRPTYYGYLDDHGKPNGTVEQVTNGVSDMGINFWYHYNFENFTTSYPFGDTGMCILTQYRGRVSQLRKIASLIDSHSRLGVCLVSLITVLFFTCYLRHGFSSSVLCTLILICNAALPKMPNKLASRIYLASIFIFVLNIHGMYQGKLASLLTKQVDLPNVKTLEDLDKFGYTTYGPVSFVRQFSNLNPRVKYKSLYSLVCMDHVLQNSRAACVFQRDLMMLHAAMFKLHLSTEPVVKLHWVYMMRDNWPPEQRFNIILRRLVEADIITFLYKTELQKLLRILQATEDQRNSPKFKVLSLSELSFAFAILAAGLLCSTVCFVAEVGVSALSIKITKAKIIIRKRVDKFINN